MYSMYVGSQVLVRWLFRKSYNRSELDDLDALILDFYRAFEAVKQWRGYEKPKLHLLAHLKRALLLYGPLRGFWYQSLHTPEYICYALQNTVMPIMLC